MEADEMTEAEKNADHEAFRALVQEMMGDVCDIDWDAFAGICSEEEAERRVRAYLDAREREFKRRIT